MNNAPIAQQHNPRQSGALPARGVTMRRAPFDDPARWPMTIGGVLVTLAACFSVTLLGWALGLLHGGWLVAASLAVLAACCVVALSDLMQGPQP